MVFAPVRSIIPSLKHGDYLSVQAHKPRLTLPVSAEAVFDLQSNSSSRTSFIVCKGIKVFNSIETIGRIFGKEVSDPL